MEGEYALYNNDFRWFYDKVFVRTLAMRHIKFFDYNFLSIFKFIKWLK